MQRAGLSLLASPLKPHVGWGLKPNVLVFLGNLSKRTSTTSLFPRSGQGFMKGTRFSGGPLPSSPSLKPPRARSGSAGDRHSRVDLRSTQSIAAHFSRCQRTIAQVQASLYQVVNKCTYQFWPPSRSETRSQRDYRRHFVAQRASSISRPAVCLWYTVAQSRSK